MAKTTTILWSNSPPTNKNKWKKKTCRDITLPTKVHPVKAMLFPVVRYGLWDLDYKESWVPKNWCFWTWCWKRLLKVPWTARSNQSILKEINPEYSSEGLLLKLKLQNFGHLMRSADSCERPWCKKDWGKEEKGVTEDEMVGWYHQLNGHELEQAPGDGEGQGSLHAAIYGVES